MKNLIVGISVICNLLFIQTALFAQKTCTSNPTTISGDINFGAIVWTASGGATGTECDNMADGLITFTGNVVIDLANNKIVTISNNVNIDGNFLLSGGPGATLTVSGGGTATLLYVTGDLGESTNNGVQYSVPLATDSIRVDGTLYGKNNNAFTGSGGISGGSLNVKNGTTCGSPCPVEGNFDSCTDGGDSFCSNNSVLPIELLFFRSHVSNANVRLEWSTASEENNDYFSVERSKDGINYTVIETVPGTDYSATILEYFYIDKYPLYGRSYYRLKQTDFDGASETFKPIAVDFTTLTNRELSFQPNPVRKGEKIIISTGADSEEVLRLSVYSLIGELIVSQVSSGSNFEFLLDENMKPGVYLIKVSSINSQQIGRLFLE